ncbi:MAG: lipoyl synthase [Chloroflexi bacterium]|nr:lipoyl synthase [Chloroflexota bacterium]
MRPQRRLPPWFKVRFPGGPNYLRVKGLLDQADLHTVCQEARCPNIGQCFEEGTATFLILGDVCTRDCRFCAVAPGRPAPPDPQEPERVARTVAQLGLRYAVVTSVTRDDLPDGGAGHYAQTIAKVRERSPDCRLEVLIPDFKGNEAALATVVAASPEVLNHNVETVPRLYPKVRPQAVYTRSLALLRRAKELSPGLVTKSGLMVGLGERMTEMAQVMVDLRRAGCDLLTIGQYLAPSASHLPVARFYEPEEFADLAKVGRELGFRHVESGPLVRSSYHAARQAAYPEA